MNLFRRPALIFAVVLAGALGSACGSSSTSSSAVHTGPPSASLTLGGSAGVAGPITTKSGITCSDPSPTKGLQIDLLGTPADPNLSVFLFFTANNVAVRLDSGAGATYKERDFSGGGITSFDAASGVTFDTKLSEPSPDPAAAGTLGVVTSIKGSIECGNQKPGSSTITVTGTSPAGLLNNAKIDPVIVKCYNDPQYGKYVVAHGIVHAGSTPLLFFVTLQSGNFVMFVSGTTSGSSAEFQGTSDAAGTTISTTKGHVTGTATDGKGHTLKLSGDVTCGSGF
jgi:hypothetical protein